ncbi:MAG: PhoH family protein [bacterium]|jgi:phosphate starvation-inducible PhoH-like protein
MRSSGKKERTDHSVQFREVKALNYIQQSYLDAIASKSIVFGIGSAGTGKTFVAASYAAQQLYYRRINKIVITRPSVETGRGMGFLPGELDEKYAPYLQPFESVFTHCLGTGFYNYAIKNKTIDPKPIGFMRGSNFEDSIVLVDEAQNLTKTELKMLLTRIGRNCTIVLSGDPKQVDITNSGLLDAVARLEPLAGVAVVRFLDSDIVRSQMCKQVILAYND